MSPFRLDSFLFPYYWVECQRSLNTNNMSIFNDIQSIGVDQSNRLMCLSTFFSWNFFKLFFFSYCGWVMKTWYTKDFIRTKNRFSFSYIEVVCMLKNAQINEGIWLLFFWGNCFMCFAFQIYTSLGWWQQALTFKSVMGTKSFKCSPRKL